MKHPIAFIVYAEYHEVMGILISMIVNGIAVFISAYVIPGITVDSLFTAVLVAVFLAIVNTIIRPILIVLTLPITILTLGLFVLVINAFMVILVSKIVPGFHVANFWSAFLFSIVLAVVSFFLGSLK